MCGFFATFGKTALSLSNEQDLAFSRLLNHRGPDEFHTLSGSGLKVMFWRLSIVDQVDGKQPMSTPDGQVTILFNGEIYNHRHLRARLETEGFLFRTQSDTEVALAAYRAWGTHCFSRFEGMFAICVVDRAAGRILLARDRLGVKPLYFFSEQDGLTVASEQKAILQSRRCSAKLDLTSFLSYLVFQSVVGTGTLFRGVQKVLPGWIFTFDLETQSFLGSEPVAPERHFIEVESYVEFRDRLRTTILEQTRLAYDTDLPSAFHLSGGLDSNTLIGLYRYFDPHREPVCITSLVEGEQDPEWPFIRDAAQYHRAKLRVVSITAEKFWDVLDEVIFHLDEPVGDPGVVAQFLVNQLASHDCKIVYSGQGLDEMFLGYIRNLGAYLLAAYGAEALLLRNNQSETLPKESLEFLEDWDTFIQVMMSPMRIDPELAFFKTLCRINPFEASGRVAREITGSLRTLALDVYLSIKQSSRSLHEFMMRAETEIQLPSLLQMEDRASMRYSLETRVPFCTAAIFNVARASRLEWTLWRGQPKGILRDIFCDVVPPGILKRRQKVGRPIPLRRWLCNERGSQVVQQLADQRELFEDLMGADFIEYAVNHPNPYDRSLWAIISLSRWMSVYSVTV